MHLILHTNVHSDCTCHPGKSASVRPSPVPGAQIMHPDQLAHTMSQANIGLQLLHFS